MLLFCGSCWITLARDSVEQWGVVPPLPGPESPQQLYPTPPAGSPQQHVRIGHISARLPPPPIYLSNQVNFLINLKTSGQGL